MAESPTHPDDIPPAGPSASVPRRRFRELPADTLAVDSLVVDAAELDTAFHQVDELGEGLDRVSFRQTPRDDAPIDMTPMVDVTFLLLIFFMVTAAFSLQRSLQVPTPRPDEPSANAEQRESTEEADLITVHVDENNTFRVVTTELDVEAPSTHELLIRLREARDGAPSGRKPTRLLVMANVDALHERVIAAMDAGSQVEMEEVQLMMVEENE